MTPQTKKPYFDPCTRLPNSDNILKCPFLHQLYTIRYKYIAINIPNKNTFVAGITQEKH